MSIKVKMKRKRLRWSSHVKRRFKNAKLEELIVYRLNVFLRGLRQDLRKL